MSDQVKDNSLLYKRVTYLLMFYVGIFFYFMSAITIYHILNKGYSHVFFEFDFVGMFFYSVIAALFFCFFITIPMIIGVVVLIERYKFKWFKAYFIVTFLSSIVFGCLFQYGKGFDKILLQAVVPCLFTQYIVWLFFNRVFDRLNKRYNLK